MMNFYKLTGLSMLVSSFMMMNTAQAQQEAPSVFVDRISKDLANTLVANKAKYKKNPAYLKKIVLQKIVPYVDTKGFSKGVMGKHYKNMTAAQRVNLENRLKIGLIDTYSSFLGGYNPNKYKFTVLPYKGKNLKKPEVVMRFRNSSGERINITYKLVGINNQWKIRDVSAQGLVAGKMFRKQFSDTMSKYNNNADKATKYFLPKVTTK